ncbi:hypothetical protein B5X24_HaOG205900 [Helicoverpa armigera]|uniref:RNA-directed DNA polymerase n=1 Tax=Helicoverpa armigera TaxID=29058 RepID=A0A2W1BPU0_HELAM|nr:hypothetical protein B5X24_HaOG205900 [Helicoverpa armigera]
MDQRSEREASHRRLETPSRGHTRLSGRRSRSRSRSRSHIHSRSHSRSHSLRLREREVAVEREREHLRLLEQDLQEERERESRQHGARRRRQEDGGVDERQRGLQPQPSQNAHSSHRNLDYKNILPEFNPSNKSQRMDVWLKKVNECASVYGWDDKTIVHFAMQKLQGLAKTWYESLDSILYSWNEWQTKLINAFPCEQNFGQSLEDMLKRRCKFNEPIENYYYEKLALLNQCEITGKKAVDCIIHGINDRTLRSSALALRCVEPDQLLKFLSSNSKESFSQQISNNNRNLNSTNNDKTNNKFNSKGPVNQYIRCYNCKEIGHPYQKCTKPLVRCNKCNRVGQCVESCSETGTTNKPNTIVSKTMLISNANPNDKFIKEVSVNGVSLQAFVDLGSEVTLIRHTEFSKLGLEHDNSPSKMKGFGNNVVQSVGSVKLNLNIDGVNATVPCRIVEDSLLEKPLLIGQTFSEQSHIVVYKDANKLQFTDAGADIRNICLGGEKQPLLQIYITDNINIFGAASVKAAIRTKFTVPCQLLRNFIFSRVERVDVVKRLVTVAPGAIDEHQNLGGGGFDESLVRLGESVSVEAKNRLFKLLRRYEGCFAHDLAGLGCTNVASMKIELDSKRPVVYRPYRLSHHEREKVRGMVDEMLQANIIRESVSNYASPIILVRKKDGNLRMCVDYRMLNSITVKERYPMPLIEDEIARLSGHACFITLDLMSGYYQVPISEECKHLTAFITPDGHYEYNRMPFGLANAPAVFQRMMNHVLGAARFDKATVYIDDLLIFGKDATECLDRFEEILQLLQKADLKLNLSKCNFLKDKINYLGYEISAAGMRPGSEKIQSVIHFPCPQNVHGVRQFLGLVGYFRKFIQNFAQIANPLTKLLKKNISWEWTDEQNNAFIDLKNKLSDRPILAIYSHTAETELHTDASRLGIGGIVLQRPQGSSDSFRPVAYFSRQTTPQEKNFHSYELETLAVVCSLKKFRVYLLGKSFRIITDCSALRSTFQKRDLIPRIARWWLVLQEFDCEIEYRSGVKMSHVDALSRNPIDTKEIEDPVRYPAVLAISDNDWLLTLQLGDSELCKIRDVVSSNLDSKGLEYIKENYVLKDNKLFRCLGGDKDKLRWVVPKGARWQLCRLNHDEIGHVGFEKTFEHSLTAQNFNDDDREWDNKLGKIQWGLNNTMQKTTGRSPAEIMFGTSISSEISPILDEVIEQTREDNDLSSLRDDVKTKIDEEQQKQKLYYDKGRRPARLYEIGRGRNGVEPRPDKMRRTLKLEFEANV